MKQEITFDQMLDILKCAAKRQMPQKHNKSIMLHKSGSIFYLRIGGSVIFKRQIFNDGSYGGYRDNVISIRIDELPKDDNDKIFNAIRNSQIYGVQFDSTLPESIKQKFVDEFMKIVSNQDESIELLGFPNIILVDKDKTLEELLIDVDLYK